MEPQTQQFLSKLLGSATFFLNVEPKRILLKSAAAPNGLISTLHQPKPHFSSEGDISIDKKWFDNYDQSENFFDFLAHQKESIPFTPPKNTYFLDLNFKKTFASTIKPPFKYIIPTTLRLSLQDIKSVETTTDFSRIDKDMKDDLPNGPVIAMLKQVVFNTSLSSTSEPSKQYDVIKIIVVNQKGTKKEEDQQGKNGVHPSICLSPQIPPSVLKLEG